MTMLGAQPGFDLMAERVLGRLGRNFCDEVLRGVGLWPEGGG